MEGRLFMGSQKAQIDASRKLYIFLDCDFTLVHGHTHNTIVNESLNLSGEELHNAEWDLVKHFEIFGDAKRWREVIMNAIDEGHEFAVVSYSQFPHIIQRFLKEKMGLDQSYLEKIKIESWLGYQGKDVHIANVMKEKGVKITPEVAKRIVLMDDSGRNIRLARAQGYQTIMVDPESDDHIEKLATLIAQYDEQCNLTKPGL